jgi:hypothetical protein
MMICLYGASVQLIPDAASFIGSIFAFVGFLFDILVQNAGRNGDFWFNVRRGYVVVDHVPFEVIDRLLAERPDVEGVTLPGMPPGSPGMPGEKSGKWKIYAFKNGRVWLYAVS